MFHLELTEEFSAAHALRNYPGICARIHGHNWKVTAGLSCAELDKDGMTADYSVLRKALMEIIGQFDHTLINDHPYFQKKNPTSEEMAKFFFYELSEKMIEPIKLDFIKISETNNFTVTYKPF